MQRRSTSCTSHFIPGKIPDTPKIEVLVGKRLNLGHSGEQKSLFPLLRIKSRFLSCPVHRLVINDSDAVGSLA
jgi:hypothetical protein